VACSVTDGVGERVALAELTLVPDEVDVVEVPGYRLGRPGPAARPADQLEAGVDALDVVAQAVSGERAGADVVVGEFRGRCPPAGQVEAFDEPLIVHDLLRCVSLPGFDR
jgi:hypothetical protein